ncbi:hypothetical protein NDU88_002575 [Pleurodeles waltl]|uniref:Uncharacterized protein n=1 Tax=Pleurodeles waltl TaxID=8319 RepID=A0AAV7M0Z6_PLEWA|nr:hypothetical protein NDU88_002575 [Pleurodeles waltl]
MGAPDAPRFVGCGGKRVPQVRESAGPPLDLVALPRRRPPMLGLAMVGGSSGRLRLRHPRRAARRPGELVSYAAIASLGQTTPPP